MIILERFCDHPDLGCIGELYIEGARLCYTIEQPWNDNRPFRSSVPIGEYSLVKYNSRRYGMTYALSNPELDVVVHKDDALPAQRYACLFHAANWSSQLQGCIAPGAGMTWGKREANHKTYEPTIMVTDSRNTMRTLLDHLDNERLLIRWKHGR